MALTAPARLQFTSPPRNEMRCIEPCTFGNADDIITRRPPVMRAQATVLQQLQNLIHTCEAACLDASVIAELQAALVTIHGQSEEFWRGDGRFWNHFRDHGLMDAQGFEIETPVENGNRFAPYYTQHYSKVA